MFLLASLNYLAQNTPTELRAADSFQGEKARVIEVTIPLGKGSAQHHPPGLVLAYVPKDFLKSTIVRRPPQLVKEDEVFYEPSNVLHTRSASAPPDRQVRFLISFVEEKESEIPIRER